MPIQCLTWRHFRKALLITLRETLASHHLRSSISRYNRARRSDRGLRRLELKMVVSKRLCVDGVRNGASGGGRKGRAEAEEAATPERRSSARLKQLRDQKGKTAASLADVPGHESEKPRKKRASLKRKINVVEEASEAKEDSELEGAVNTQPCVSKSDLINGLPRARVDEVGVGRDVVENGAGTSSAKEEIGAATSDLARVKYTLRKFTKYYLHFIQEEEKRCKKVVPIFSKSKKPKKGKDTIEDKCKSKIKRPDLKAITKMRETNSILYPEKRIGDKPGIYAGYQFFSRAEMVVIGFHSNWLNGIDYMGQNYSKVYKNYTFLLAVAIVVSGQYEDDLDNSEDVIYTGQGGNNLLGNKRQVKDQDLNRSNLARKNSWEHSQPVRVRGHKCKNSYVGKVYTYYGLYEVVKWWPEQGLSGFTVYKYKLRRLNGQASLTTNQVHFAHGEVPKVLADIRGLVCEDISGGKERIPIPATNLVDDPSVAPSDFSYVKAMKLSNSVKVPSHTTGCKCKRACVDSRILIEAKDVIFECGPGCGCGPDCVNRASQRGIEYKLEVFRTSKKGWAMRSWDFIPSGAPVCEYVGVLTKTNESDHDRNNNYIFDIDCAQTMKGLDGREKRYRNVSSIVLQKEDDGKSDMPEYCIDAGSSGNVARFLNHSCEPNLFVQCVLSAHHDARLASIMLFAADNFSPLQELTYDYGYALDSVVDTDGKPKELRCYCGAADCRKRLF